MPNTSRGINSAPKSVSRKALLPIPFNHEPQSILIDDRSQQCDIHDELRLARESEMAIFDDFGQL
jgi:hypothetical protein